jgi:Lon protease-like protein
MSEPFSPLADFMGTVRLFPLPNLVLFPEVMQPLHIFEPRYRQMTADALAGDRLIALALLQPGWEPDYAGSPAIHAVGCIGRIIADQRLPDGRYNILVRGLSRIQVVEEISHAKPYRKARADLLVDVDVEDPKAARELRKRLQAMVPRWFGKQKAVLDQIRNLFKSDLPLCALGDIFAFTLALDMNFKQELLEEVDVERRVRRLLKHLEAKKSKKAATPPERTFPPEFSVN